MNLTWKKLSQKTIRLNRYRSVVKKKFRLPNGYVGDFFTVGKARVVCALVVTDDKKVVLAKQFRPGVEKVLRELPGGGIDKRETPKQAILREVLEETGYVGNVQSTGTSSNDGWTEIERHHFVVTNAKRVGQPKHDESEMIEVETVSMKTFLSMLEAGKMSDSETAYRGLVKLGVLKVVL